MFAPLNAVTSTTMTFAGAALYSALLLSPMRATAQMPMPTPPSTPTQTQPDAPAQGQDTQAQITKLKQQVAQLQVALQQSKGKNTPAAKGATSPEKPTMRMGDDSGEMEVCLPVREKRRWLPWVTTRTRWPPCRLRAVQ